MYNSKGQNIIETQMYDYAKDCGAALSRIVHPNYVTEVAQIICRAYLEEDFGAEYLCSKLGISKLHCFAMLDMEDKFSEELQKEQEEIYCLKFAEDL